MQETFHVALWCMAIFLGCLWTLLGLLVAGAGWMFLRPWFSQLSWPRLPAKIVSSEVRTVRCPNRPDRYQPVFALVFTSATGETSSDHSLIPGKVLPTEEEARQRVESFPSGTATAARRNPNDPSEAALKRQGGFRGLLLLCLGIFLMAAPLLFVDGLGLPVWPPITILALIAATVLIVDESNRRWLQRARRSGLYPAPGRGSDEDVERLAQEGERGLAIYLYRELHSCDLKTAREQVEAVTPKLKTEEKKNP